MKREPRRAGLRTLATAALLLSQLATGPGAPRPATAAEPPGLRVLASAPGALVVELTTGPATRTPVQLHGQTFDALALPATDQTQTPGAPQVPVRGALLGVPTLSGLAVTVIAAEEAETIAGLRLAPAPTLIAADLGAPPTTAYTPDPAFYGGGAYPGRLVALGASGRLRDQPVAQLLFYPIQYDPATGTATHYQRLVARLTWDATQAGAALRPESAAVQQLLARSLLNSADLPTAPQPASFAAPAVVTSPAAVTPSLKISLTASGLYTLTYAQLTEAGFSLSGVDPRTLHLTWRGAEVPMQVVGEGDGVFNPSDYVLFYGERYEDLYTNVNVYWLTSGGANGRRMAAEDGTPGAAPVPTHFPVTVHAEVNQNYWQNQPNGAGQDHWYWGGLLSPNTSGLPTYRDYSDGMAYPPAGCGCLTLNNLSTSVPTATVSVRLRGYTTPNHKTQIAINGTPVVTATWSGQGLLDLSATFSRTLLANGSNTVRVAALSVPSTPDQILVDWIELTYWDRYVAEANSLRFGAPSAGAHKFQVGGFTGSVVSIFNVTDPLSPTVITGAAVSGSGPFTVTFQTTATTSSQYLAGAPGAFKSPAGLTLDTPTDWRSPSHGADWIVITDPAYAASAQALANFRATQGLRTAVVQTPDLYDEFNAGLPSPQAIKDFLAYAYADWQPPAPAYVVLLGDACQDYKNARWDTASACTHNGVPTQVYESSVYGQVPSDYWYTTVSGSDLYPDLFLGRISAQTPQQAADIVAKLVAYDQSPPGVLWGSRAAFVADDGDVTFETISNQLAAALPAGFQANRIYAADFPPGSPAASLSSALHAGSLLVNYFGHGAIQRWGTWSGGEIFNAANVDALTNAGRYPFVTVGDCLNGLFSLSDAQPSFAETWQRAAGKGAVAVWAPSSVGVPTSHRRLMLALYAALFVDDLEELGPATTAAVVDLLAANEGYEELAATYLLFGDPATRLGVPDVLPAYTYLPQVAR